MKDRTLSGRLKEKSADLKLRNEEIRNLKLDIMTLEEKLNATQLTLSETESTLTTLYRKLERGAFWITHEDGHIKNAGELPPNAILLYNTQVEVNRKELLKGYTEFQNGKVIINADKKRKYINTFEGGIK